MAGHNLFNTKAYDPTDAVFGKQPDGTTFHFPLSKGPHWIVAGQTGSGKSVFVNGLLMSCIYHSHPDELKIYIIDPKKVEFSAYKGLPYCPIDPVIDMGDAFGLMSWACYEMDERYSVIEVAGVKNIEEFNDLVRNHSEKIEAKAKAYEESGATISDDVRARLYEPLPYMLVIIDEFADLVMTAGRDIEDLIVRLGQKARAAGITCLIATQRPSADVISPLIKANVPSRIGLKTTDQTNSMIVIDEAGCEKLAGYGDGIIKLVNGDMVRLQGPYLSNDEIDNIFASLRKKYDGYQDEPFDYKTVCVEKGLADWAEDYDESIPMSQRHIKQKKRSRFG